MITSLFEQCQKMVMVMVMVMVNVNLYSTIVTKSLMRWAR